MTKLKEIYVCEMCGNITEVLSVGGGELVCCGEPMVLQKERAADAGLEKHVPVIEATDSGIKVKVGDVPHPMQEKHYIEWVEVIAGGKSCRIFLSPGQKPEAEFDIKPEKVTAREYCTIHGLWKST